MDIDDVTPGDGVVVHHGQQLGDGVGVETGGIGSGAVEAVFLGEAGETASATLTADSPFLPFGS